MLCFLAASQLVSRNVRTQMTDNQQRKQFCVEGCLNHDMLYKADSYKRDLRRLGEIRAWLNSQMSSIFGLCISALVDDEQELPFVDACELR